MTDIATLIDTPSLLTGYLLGILAVYTFHLIILPLRRKESIRMAWQRLWGAAIIVETEEVIEE